MKWLIKILMALVLLVPAQVWAASDERGGFRDLYWGESLESVQRTREIECINTSPEMNVARYWVNLDENEPPVLAGIPIHGEGFIAVFWKNQLTAVIIAFSNENSNFWAMKNSLIYLHGQPYHDETLPWVTSTMEGMGRSGDMDYDGGTYFWMDRTTYYLLLHHAEYDEVFFVVLMPIKEIEKFSNEQAVLGW